MQIVEGPKGIRPTPWWVFADGQWRIAKAGEDFTDPVRFRRNGKAWASRSGMRWQSEMDGADVRFCISHKEKP